MVNHSTEQSTIVIEAPCQGAGCVLCTTLLDAEITDGACEILALCVMPEGSACGVHRHVGDSEAYYIVEGTARIIDDGEEVILCSGDVNYCRDGHTHSIENVGKGDLRYIALKLFSSTHRQ